MAAVHTQLLRLPGAVEAGFSVEHHLETWLEGCTPDQLIALVDTAALALIRGAFAHVGAHEGTIWIADRKVGELVASYNSGENAEDLVGFRQPMDHGIISMVYAQQQPYCENSISRDSGHDDTLDRKIAKHTTAMIAVPFYFGFGLRGVISAVQLSGEEKSRDGFRSVDLESLARATNLVGRLIDGSLFASLLGLGDGI